MTGFAWPWIWVLLPLPWVVGRLVPAARTETLRAPLVDLLEGLPAGVRQGRSRAWLWLAWVLLVGAAARPLGEWRESAAPRSGAELMVALDISASMATRDLTLDGSPADRFAVARALVRRLVEARPGDRIGLVVFGSAAHVDVPSTTDHALLLSSMDGIEVGLAGQQTALGDAVALAVKRLGSGGGTSRTVFLLTDGARSEGSLSLDEAGAAARDAGVRVMAVGIGVPSSTPEPTAELDEPGLRALAGGSGGRYARVTDGAALDALYAAADATAAAPGSRPSAEELYPWPVAAALAVLLVSMLWRGRGDR